MQQETTEALNEIPNADSSDRETIEHLNSTNSYLIRHIKTLKKIIQAFQSQMLTRFINN